MENQELVKLAKDALHNAYSPYSNYKVGAAVLGEDGNIYKGCNIENVSYGATICAERVAISSAIANGNKTIQKIAIVSSSDKYTYPCGICRQVMAEFMNDDALVILSEGNEVKEFMFKVLHPHSFDL